MSCDGELSGFVCKSWNDFIYYLSLCRFCEL